MLDSETATVRVELGGPIDLAASLAPLGRWGDDGLDRWDGHTLVRTMLLGDDDSPVPYLASLEGSLQEPALQAKFPAALRSRETQVVSAIRATFMTDRANALEVARNDDAVDSLASRYPAVVPVLFPETFLALIRSISAQQVNLRWASTIRRRLAEAYGVRHEIGGEYVYNLDPGRLARATIDELRALQLTNAKARSAIAVARAAESGNLRREDLDALDDEALIGRLTLLPGIGRWSAEWFIARTLGRPRVVAGDLGVRKAIGRMYATPALPTEDEVRQLTSHWGAAATLIQALALHDLAVATGVA